MNVQIRSLPSARWFWPLVLALAVLAALAGAGVAQAAPASQTGTRPVDCPTACQARVDAWIERCEAGGTAAEDCRAKAVRLMADCISSCERQTRPVPAPRLSDCEIGCRERAKAWLERCKAAGGSTIGAVDCNAGARKLFAECVASCDPAPPSDCAGRCKERVAAWLERCKAGGGSASGRDCDAQARKLYAECVTSCEPKRDPPADCASACKARVRAWIGRCKAGGGSDCDAEGRRLYAECVANCPSTRPAPGPREPRP